VVAALKKAVTVGADLPDSWGPYVIVSRRSDPNAYRSALTGLLLSLEPRPQHYWATAGAFFGETVQDHVAACVVHDRCTQRYPNVGTNFYNAGISHFRAGDFARARERFTAAIQLSEAGSTLAWINRGWAYFFEERYEDAKKDWRAAITLDPEHDLCGSVLGSLTRRDFGSDSAEFIRHLKEFHVRTGLTYWL
jgi:tetratricopeptide (TPR) repeat protein